MFAANHGHGRGQFSVKKPDKKYWNTGKQKAQHRAKAATIADPYP